jgi:hypothetical protein
VPDGARAAPDEHEDMLIHPELLRELAKEHQRDLIHDADAHRLLARARRRSSRPVRRTD